MSTVSPAIVMVLSAYRCNQESEKFTSELLAAGVAKGTVSKMRTVLHGLHAGLIHDSECTSLNNSYTRLKVKQAEVPAVIRRAARDLNRALEDGTNLDAVLSRARGLVRLIQEGSK